MYSISLKLGTETITGEGETILEALEAMENPVKIFTKGILKVTDGDKSYETMLMPQRVKRLFYPQAQFHMAKNLGTLLK